MAARHQRIDVVDNNGTPVKVTKVTPRIPAGTLSNPDAHIEGLADYFLPDGTRLSRTTTGFETVDGSRWFTRV